jgi:hypothetical protein
LKEAFAGCDGVISALGDDRKTRPEPLSFDEATAGSVDSQTSNR